MQWKCIYYERECPCWRTKSAHSVRPSSTDAEYRLTALGYASALSLDSWTLLPSSYSSFYAIILFSALFHTLHDSSSSVGCSFIFFFLANSISRRNTRTARRLYSYVILVKLAIINKSQSWVNHASAVPMGYSNTHPEGRPMVVYFVFMDGTPKSTCW